MDGRTDRWMGAWMDELKKHKLHPCMDNNGTYKGIKRAEKEERLIPYKADLGIHPPFFATYDKMVQDVRGAQTFPTNLESTTLMLAYGMDVFYTRLSPSKSFDMLDDDF
eukprot:scaffold27883_cov33-Prasinocladus_malaysianus.AAC.1